MRELCQKLMRISFPALVSLVAIVPSFAQTDFCSQATESFHARQWERAATAFSECEKLAPGKTDALLYRGKALVNLQDFPAASASLEAYIQNRPASDDALYLLGYVRFRQDRPKESLEMFARAAKIRAPQESDLKIAALDYVLLNDYNSAAKYLEGALQMDPQDAEARYHLGRVRYQQNQFDKAIEAFNAVLKQDPANVRALDNLGLCLEAKNRNQEAVAMYRKAVQADSSAAVRNAQPYIDFGKLLNTLNRADEAAPLLSQAVQIEPRSTTAHYQFGRALFLLAKFDDARAQVEEAIRLDPMDSSQHYLLGRIYSRMGKSAEAAAEFKLTDDLIRQKNAKSGGMATGR